MKSVLGLWLPVAAYIAAIFFVSSIQQPPPLPSAIPLVDKWAHALLYGGLAVVILRALAGGMWSGVTISRAARSAIGATLYGVTDEIHQLFVPGRLYDVVDMIADAIGAVLAVLVILGWGIIRRREERSGA